MTLTETLKETTTLRAVIYTRVIPQASVVDTVDELRELQLQAGERKAAAIHAKVVGWYDDDQPDDGYRKGIWKLLERVVGDRDVDVVIVDRRNTLDRSRAGQKEIRELIAAGGANLVIAEAGGVAETRAFSCPTNT